MPRCRALTKQSKSKLRCKIKSPASDNFCHFHFPIFSNSKCEICGVRDGTSMLDCGHNFHQMCLDFFLDHENPSCPKCKKRCKLRKSTFYIANGYSVTFNFYA